MYRYPLNGRPAAFYRGDWFVGKGVAAARIRFGEGEKDVAEVFTTHMHAPYEKEPYDSYICHRTAQAWEVAKFMRHAGGGWELVLHPCCCFDHGELVCNMGTNGVWLWNETAWDL